MDFEYYVDDENKDGKLGFKFLSVNVPVIKIREIILMIVSLYFFSNPPN